ncbi:MAG: cellulase family glycosylhydrolase [Reyranella sp.]|nr:cellulase family glycosylhydrolase [Reyranella sp.]
MATINYTVGDNWGSGFIGNIKVPGGTSGLHGWTLEFDAAFDISNIWGAEIVSHVGNHYVIRNVAWNADVAVGAQASFGFEAKAGSGGTTATGFTLNGATSTPTPPPVVVPTLSIDDASIAEGDSGTSQLTFTVKLSQAATGPVTVSYSTANGTATAGSDYSALTGTLTFAAGETTKTITVPITGDTAVEANETFTVNLANPSGATIADGAATGTIVNNDVAPPPPTTGSLSLDYDIVSNWGSGFTASMAVGAGGSALSGWTVAFDASFNITSIWNATIVSHVGNHYVVKNVDWNGNVAGGKEVSFGFQATPGSGGTAASGFTINGTAVGTNPPPLPTLSVADATVAEGNSGTHELAFTVTLSAAATGPVTVAYATSNGTATAGSDYTAASGTLTFAAGETSKVIKVVVTGDATVEANETVTLTLSSPGGATIADGTAVGTITNDDTAPLPTLAVADATVSEGNSGTRNLAFTISLSAAATGPVTVAYATSNGTATAGSDYTAASGTVTFAAGETSKVVNVQVAGDTVVEANETLTLTLSSPTGATIADSTAIGTISNDDIAPLPTLAVADATVTEGNSGTRDLAFTVTLSAAATGPVTVAYATSNGTATAGSDYTAATGTVTFAAGETSKVINVQVTGDTAVEANETLTLTLSSPTGATIADGTAIGTITNDDTAPPPTLTVADATVTEGNSGTRNLAFTVTLSAAATGPVTVAYATSNGTATAGSDYTAATGTVTFAAGETSKVINVQVTGDTAVEANETLTLTLSSPSGATIADGTAIGTITNDDTAPLPTLAVADATVSEGNSGATDLAFTVSLSAAATGPVTVAYATSNGTATAGSDYTAATGTVTFAAGETSKVVHIQVNGDTAVEANETLTLTLSSPTGATIADGTAIGTITNDDTAPLPTVSISDASVVEGNPGQSGGGGGAAAGWFSTSGNQIVDSAGHSVQIAGVNWFGFESSNLAPHGLWTRGYKDMMDQMKDLGFNTIRLPFSNDTIHSGGTPNGIDFSKNPDLQGLTAMQIMDKIVAYAGEIGLKIILDHHRNDSGPGTSSNGLWYDAQHPESQWLSDWQMLATRYANDPTVIGADLHNEPYNGTWGGGGATDWAAAAERAGNAIGSVNPNWLIFVEGVGTYQGQPYWWGGNLMGVRDRPVDLNVDNKLVYSAHDYPNSVWAQPWFQGSDFPANLPAKFDQMWGYIYKEGIAPVYIGEFGTNLTDPKDAPWLEAITSYLAGDLDNNGTTDIPAGTTGVSWTFWSWNPNSGDTGGILANDWRTVNQNKMAYLTPIEFDLVSDVSSGGSTGPHATFVVTLSAAATETVTVDYHTVTGTAGSADFTGASGTVTFAPGETSKTITIAISPDVVVEGNEQFSVVLSNPHSATIADGTGIGTIVNDDTAPPPVVPTLTINDASITEGDSGTSQLSFTVKLSQATSGPVTVNYSTANASATAGSDYTAVTGTVTFAAGETTKTIVVPITGDTTVESNETFTVSLAAASGATIADGSAVGTIVNNDAPPPTAGDLQAHLALADSWNSGFNANVVVHNDGSSMSGWQIVVEMPNQITDIWNAKIISHEGNSYVIGPAAWNGTLAHDGETSFGFVASGAYNASAVHVHGLGQDDVPDSVPTVPTALVSSAVSSTSTVLSWQASSVPGGGFVTGYDIFVDGHHVATTTSTSYRVTGLTPDTDYHFSVAAIDGAGSSDQTGAIAVHTTVAPPPADDGHMFSPYIDMAMDNAADLAGISAASGITSFTLAFVLASNEGIGWQGWGSIDDDTLFNGTTILEHVQDIQAAGGNITISFGGAAGTEAALAATSASQLQAQYQSVIDRYHIDSIDFDIEGAAVANQHSLVLRDQAIVGLQTANPDLKVSFTLPVLPTGLTADGLHVLQQAMADGVHVDMVNIMTMDYGTSVDNNGQMGISAIQASEATQQQLASIGMNAKIGITPMIGVNDIASEVFKLSDAQMLVDYAKNDPDVAMLSMWSVARDNGNSAGANHASSDSSGIAQTPYQFASIFHQYDIL